MKRIDKINEEMGFGYANDIYGSTGLGKTTNFIYNVLSLNHSLEQPATPIDYGRYIQIGSYVTGHGCKDFNKIYTGQVYKIVKDEHGEIKYLYILNAKNNTFVRIAVDGVKLIENRYGKLQNKDVGLKLSNRHLNRSVSYVNESVVDRGDCIFPKESKYVNDGKDHFPINNIRQARNAIARANQYSSAPVWFGDSLKTLLNIVIKNVEDKYPSIEISNEAKRPK